MASSFTGLKSAPARSGKRRFALVGTGMRGVRNYGRNVLENYSDYVEMVGVCDINPGRLRYAREYMGYEGPVYTDVREMLKEQRPETLMVITSDFTHHEMIITGMELGCNIIVEKPITIDEFKAQSILEAQRKYGKEIIATFNYRYPPYRAKIKELLMEGLVGDINTVDLHWNINHAHLQRYMQRWHGERDKGGTLWVHKAAHHFDLINWWLNSEPEEVQAQAFLDRFGKHGPFRADNCRNCPHTSECPYYWDIRGHQHFYRLYSENEHYDGYIRDNCVFRQEIDIYERHTAVVKYANGALLNYSLTADTDHSGYWLAFNGTKGRLEIRSDGWPYEEEKELVFTPIGKFTEEEPRKIRIARAEGGHWGGDPIMNEKLFRDPDMADPLNQQALLRDGIMSVLPGIAARKSVASGRKIHIKDLTDLVPRAKST